MAVGEKASTSMGEGMMGKEFMVTSQEPCTRCASLGRETEARIAVKEVIRGVVVHSALCEEHFTVVKPPAVQQYVKRQ
jgi:hypothetical protein